MQAVERSAPSPPALRSESRRPGATALAVTLLTLLGAGLRFWRIGHQSLWYDEALTLDLAHHTFGQMLSLVRHTEGEPPLYFSLAWIWARVFGYGDAALRSLSAVAGVAAIPVMYGAGARLLSRRAGLIAAALTACSPLLIWYSQEARSYSLLVFTAALSLLAFAHLLSPRPSAGWLATWALAAVLAAASHYYAVLIVVPEAIWLLWIHRRSPAMWLAVCAVGVAGVLLIWFAIGQKSSDAPWITGAPLSLRLGQVPPQFLLGFGAPARVWLKIAGALVLLVAVAMVGRADVRERRGLLRVGALALAAVVLGLLLIAAGFDRTITRNLIPVLLALVLLVAGALGVRRARAVGLTGAAILCAIGIVAVVGVAEDVNLERPAWRALGTRLQADRPAGAAGAIVYEDSDSTLPLADYVHGLRWLFFGAPIEEIDVVAADRVPLVSFCWWGAACSLSAAPLDTSVAVPGFHPVGPVIHVAQFSIYRLRAARPVFVTRPEVAKALSHAPVSSYGLFVQPPA